MAAQGIGHLAAGFLQAFTQSKLATEDRADKEKLRKLQTQMFELQLKREQQQQNATDSVYRRMSGQPNDIPNITENPGEIGGFNVGQPTPSPARGPGLSLTQLLSDPEGAISLLQSGMLKDVVAMQGQQRAQTFQDQLLATLGGGGSGTSGGGMGGMELEGFGLDTQGNMLPNFRRSSMDDPLKPGDLTNFRGADGSLPPPGTTMRQLVANGFRQLTTEQQGAESAVRGVTAIMQNLSGLTGRVFGTGSGLLDRAISAGANEWNRITQQNPDIVLYEDILQGSLSPVVRALGERGALAEGDVSRVMSLFPKTRPLPDTAQVAQAKIEAIGTILAAAQGGNTEEARKLIEATSAQFAPQVVDFNDLPKE